MNEAFLHYIWQTKQFSQNNLCTTDGEQILLKNVGMHNTHSGPDFVGAILEMNATRWAGNIEIHVKSSDWFLHSHQTDKQYDTCILHVVFEHDSDVFRTNGTKIPCVELKDKISPNLIAKYETITNNKNQIPCETMLHLASESTKALYVEQLAIERLQEKTEPILQKLEQQNNDWQEVFYQEVCRAMGLKINQTPFEMLAKMLPNKLLAKHKNNLFQTEALIFGVAGFLTDSLVDSYGKDLYSEFQFLKAKYQLQTIPPHLWKFLRLRPANFPTIRLAQLAVLIHKNEHLFAQTKENLNTKALHKLFKSDVSEYWKTHYRFDTLSELKEKKLGRLAIDLVIINAIVPTVFCYAHSIDSEALTVEALTLLENTLPEKNNVVQFYEKHGFLAKNALQTQGILQLKTKYCTFKKCLVCSVGHSILKQK
ncbi:MAG: DUF2851 family protein [Flavobacteriales bacterium]|nr:DUF2851 family protein [Flavobacteriales bacterium]